MVEASLAQDNEATKENRQPADSLRQAGRNSLCARLRKRLGAATQRRSDVRSGQSEGSPVQSDQGRQSDGGEAGVRCGHTN